MTAPASPTSPIPQPEEMEVDMVSNKITLVNYVSLIVARCLMLGIF